MQTCNQYLHWKTNVICIQQNKPIHSHMYFTSLLTGATELTRTPEAAHSIARLLVKLSTAALAAPVWLSGRGHTNKQGKSCVELCVRCVVLVGCLRHAREPFPHVSDDVDNDTSVLLHPRSVDCVDRTANTVRDLARTVWARPGREHLTLLAAVEGSSQVGVDHSFPAFRGHVLHWAGELTSSIVHQEVYPTVLLQHRRHQSLDLPHNFNFISSASSEQGYLNTLHEQDNKQHIQDNEIPPAPWGRQCLQTHLILVSDVTLHGSDTSVAGGRDLLSHLLCCSLQPPSLPARDHHTATWAQTVGQW